MALPTPAHRAATYQRIFRGIPRSFLDPDHPNNQAVIGAIAFAVAYTEKLYNAIEAGLFLDTAGDGTEGNVLGDGLTTIQRWALWLGLTQAPGETADQLRSRIMARLFSPKLTIDAIENAVTAATGLVVRVEEPYEEIVRFNDGPTLGKRILGDRYGYNRIVVVTEGSVHQPAGGTTNVLPRLMPFLRAAGIHWRHLEVVSAYIALLLEGKQASTAISRSYVDLWPQGFRPNYPLDPHAYPLRRRHLFTGTRYEGHALRTNHGGGAFLLAGPPGAPIENVLGRYVPPGLPVGQWDESLTIWDECVWPD